MIRKTIGIVLRVSPFSRTSHVVTWLTPDYGRVTTIIKGAQRPKSAFLGQYDLFYSCELLYYAREKNGAHIIKESSPIDTRTALRGDWKATACASYFCNLILRISPPADRNPALFHLLDGSLTHLASEGAGKPLLFWFELKAMELIGLAPRLTTCLDCNRGLIVHRDESKFSCARGGILCGACAGRTPLDSNATQSQNTRDNEAISVAGDVLTTMQEWQKAASPESVNKSRCTDRQLLETGKILGMFLRYHIQATSRSRTIAVELLN